MLTEIFPTVVFPSVFRGVLSITSDIPVSIITLRLSTNSRGDTVLATLPVVDTGQTLSTEPRALPQIAAGAGYTTQQHHLATCAKRGCRNRGRRSPSSSGQAAKPADILWPPEPS